MTWYPNSEERYGASGAKGDAGELIVEEYCSKNKIECIPKKDKNSQTKLKIDYIIEGVSIDVKTNFYNDNLAVELYLKNKNKPGWLYASTAEQIYGVDLVTKSIYRYNISDMLGYVSVNKHRAKRTKTGDIIMWVPVKTPFIEKLQ